MTPSPAARPGGAAHPAGHAGSRPRLVAVAWPMLVELALGIGVGMVGTALAARMSDASGAAFALANHVAATLFIVFRIVGAGVGVVVSQSLGSGRRDVAASLARAALGASSWVGVLTGLVTFGAAGPLLALMQAPAEVLPAARPFLQGLAPVLVLDAWNAAMAGVMRAHLRTRDTLFVIVVMHALHLALAIPLMTGAGPLPALGLPGYALALAASRLVGVALHLLLWRWRLDLVPRAADWWRLPRRELAAMLHIGAPGAAENIAYRLSYMVSVGVAASLGADALAAQAYTSQVMYAVLLFGLATGLGVEIVVGHLVGAGALHEAHRLVRRALAIGLAVSVAVATTAALAGPWLLGRFTSDAGIVAVGTTLLWWTVLLEPGRTFNLVVINALRATGDARYPVLAGAASMGLVLAGGSWLLGRHLGLGLVGLWIAYAADEWIRGLLMWRRWAGHGWVPHARATHRRLRALAA